MYLEICAAIMMAVLMYFVGNSIGQTDACMKLRVTKNISVVEYREIKKQCQEI